MMMDFSQDPAVRRPKAHEAHNRMAGRNAGDLVVMSIEAYEEMMETARTDTAISKAEREYAAEGTLLDAREALSSLRRKHFG